MIEAKNIIAINLIYWKIEKIIVLKISIIDSACFRALFYTLDYFLLT